MLSLFLWHYMCVVLQHALDSTSVDCCVRCDYKCIYMTNCWLTAGGVQQRGNQLEPHRVCRQPRSAGHDCCEAAEYLRTGRWGVEVSTGNWCHSASKAEQQPWQERQLSEAEVRHQHTVWTESLCWCCLLWYNRWAAVSVVLLSFF